MSDDQFAALFERAVGTLDPDVDRLVRAGVARGRRRQRFVRIAETGTALAVAGGLVTAGLLVSSGSDPVRPAPAARSTSATQAVATVPITAQYALQHTIDLLPRPGKTSAYSGRIYHLWRGEDTVVGNFVYDDGHGAAYFAVAVQSGSTPPDPGCAVVALTCTHRADGSYLETEVTQEHAKEHVIGKHPATVRSATLYRPDGVIVTVTAMNTTHTRLAKDAPLTRAEPPLTLAELTAIVRDPSWRTTVPAKDAEAVEGLFNPTVEENDQNADPPKQFPPDPSPSVTPTK